jgi:hypothetical protein
MIRYKTLQKEPWVVTVECPELGFPHKDVEGCIQRLNSHFDTAAEAWERLLAIKQAEQILAVTEYEWAKHILLQRTRDLAEAAAGHTKATEAFEKWGKAP